MNPSSSPVILESRKGNTTFSPAYTVGNLVFTSGQVGVDPATGTLPRDFEDEVRQVVTNLEQVLAAVGSDLSDVVKTTCFLSDIAQIAAFNKVYEESFSLPRPARSTLQARLVGDFRVEVEAIAVLR
ncbi:RidA family protein [Pseudarthrobacter sp. YAF2]|uniref:RidA family protein n=1 Tax=Pseudarthrobacter sp. YAF2 TaxID=3233078 RepID=UPI003F97E9F9